MGVVLLSLIIESIIFVALGLPQHPEINDQFETTKDPETTTEDPTEPETKEAPIEKSVNEDVTQKAKTALDAINDKDGNSTALRTTNDQNKVEKSVMTRMVDIVSMPLRCFLSTPKVIAVLRNIGTCLVNGAMEIISYYCPAPIIPLIASAAGMIIPFEPVVMLRDKMPVTSYRRALKTAVNGFLNTFDEYKRENDEDPYMTKQFNRRFMNDKNV